MSIARTAPGGLLTDDDGSNLTGTLVTNSIWQSMLDKVEQKTEQTITLTGSQNNISITSGGLEADVLYCNNASDLTVTGIAAPASPTKPGKLLCVVAIGAGQVYLSYNSGSSSVGNRIIHPVTTGPLPLGGSYGRALLTYNALSSRWEVISHEQGAWITPTFAAGDYTSATGTWTVGSGDVSVCRYYIRGRIMTFSLNVATTDVTGTPATLRRVVPGGYTLATAADQPLRASDNGGAFAWGLMQVVGGTSLYFYSTAAGGGWTAATATTALTGTFLLELT